MTINVDNFRLRFPEFADEIEYSDERIQLFIEDTECIMGTTETHWCCGYNKAQAYLTAHLLVGGDATEAGDTTTKTGTITSKAAGGVSVARSMSDKTRSEMDEWLITTPYGQRYMVYRNLCFPGVLTANSI